MVLVSAKNLSFSYPQSSSPALKDVSFTIEAGSFTLLCGKTGSGKTTLLRQLVPALAPHGQQTGQLDIDGKVGFVQQDPDNQIVTDIVFSELAFALENQGMPTQTIRRKVAEIASYFGLEYLLESPTHTLSGGQKQLLNLAATLVARPDILVLDEPTSELDPIAAQNFLRHLTRINRELGTTVICCEHRLDEVLQLSDQVLLMRGTDAEECVQPFTPQEFVQSCAEDNSNYTLYLPEPTRIALAVSVADCKQLPLDVREGRTWLNDEVSEELYECDSSHSAELLSRPWLEIAGRGREEHTYIIPHSPHHLARDGKPALRIKDLCFRYNKTEPFVLKYLSAEFAQGQVHGIVGGNASGKSTLLGLIAGVLKPQLGKVKTEKSMKLAALAQNPKASFVCDTVYGDLRELDASITEAAAQEMAQKMGITYLLDRHPYDLSGGEAQKVALAKLLLLQPDILLLDEPTKGLDAAAKQEIGHIFNQLAQEDKTLIVVTHDLPFAAQHTQSCSLLANGELIAQDTTHNFFVGNSFYTTPTYRMTRGIIEGCVTVEDAVEALSPDSEKLA